MTYESPFSEAPEHEVNREIARRLSLEVINVLQPDELVATEDVIDALIDEAARGRVIPKGADVSFGNEPLDLNAQVIVPAIIGALTGLLASAGARSLLLLKNKLDVEAMVNGLLLENVELATRKQYTPAERRRVKQVIHKIFTGRLSSPSAFDSLKRETLMDLFAARSEEYRQVAVQVRDTIEPGAIVRLKRQMAALEEEMRGYEYELKILK